MTQPTSGAARGAASSASGVAWNLKDLYDGVDDPQITRDLESARLRAQKFEKDYRGKIASADAGAAVMLRAAVTELQSQLYAA